MATFDFLPSKFYYQNEVSKILVAEDDLYLRELYCDLLKSEGFEVDSASDGPETFTKMKMGGWDLILLDIVLPKLGGLEILRKLQTDPPLIKNGSIIFLTNLGTEKAIKEGFKLGGTGFLIKSQLTPEQVLTEVKNFLTKKVPA